jgi:hypothetical protein
MATQPKEPVEGAPTTPNRNSWRVIVDQATASRQGPLIKRACPNLDLLDSAADGKPSDFVTVSSNLTLEQANTLMLTLDRLGVPSRKQPSDETTGRVGPTEQSQPKRDGQIRPSPLPGKPEKAPPTDALYSSDDLENGGEEARAFASEVAQAVRALQGPFDAGKDALPRGNELFKSVEKGAELGRLIFGIAIVIISGKRISARETVLLRALRSRFGPEYSDQEGAASIALLRKIYDEHWMPLATDFRPVLEGIGFFVAPLKSMTPCMGQQQRNKPGPYSSGSRTSSQRRTVVSLSVKRSSWRICGRSSGPVSSRYPPPRRTTARYHLLRHPPVSQLRTPPPVRRLDIATSQRSRSRYNNSIRSSVWRA